MLKKKNNFNLLLSTGIIMSVLVTPNINVDSIILPKFIILVSIAFSTIPLLSQNLKYLYRIKLGKILLFILLIILIQLVLAVIFSSSPFEQQLYGQFGRGLGFLTEISLILILVYSLYYVNLTSNKILFKSLFISGLITCVYSILQKFDLDIFSWGPRENGIGGLFGNPNFQSAFAAMMIIPTIVYARSQKNGLVKVFIYPLPLLILLYISSSTQGLILSFFSVCLFILIYTWHKKRLVFYIYLFFFTLFGFILLLGALGHGPLSEYLYTRSVRARGDIFRTSLIIAKSNPFSGVGLDSLGDYYLANMDLRTANSVGEFTNSAHNLFLHYASTGGFILALSQYAIVLLVIYSFMKSQKNFNLENTSVFIAWSCYQIQALISPPHITLMFWNVIFTSIIINFYLKSNNFYGKSFLTFEVRKKRQRLILIFFMLGLSITYPLFKVDYWQAQAGKTGDARLAIRSVTNFPESTGRYNLVIENLLKSGLNEEALYIAKEAVEFNRLNLNGWLLIISNESASVPDKIMARNQILKLDPNYQVRNEYILPDFAP